MTVDKVTIENGKYTFICDNGRLEILRNGQPWRKETGDNALLGLMYYAIDLEHKLNGALGALHDAAKCNEMSTSDFERLRVTKFDEFNVHELDTLAAIAHEAIKQIKA